MTTTPGFRFSLRTLAIVVAIVAAFCAALVNASTATAAGAVFATGLLLILSIIAAVESRSSGRAFWRGFAIAGWLYFLLVFSTNRPTPSVAAMPELVFDKLARMMPSDAQTRPISSQVFTADGVEIVTDATLLPATRRPFVPHFITIGQAWLTLLIALLGGGVGQFVHARSNRQP